MLCLHLPCLVPMGCSVNPHHLPHCLCSPCPVADTATAPASTNLHRACRQSAQRPAFLPACLPFNLLGSSVALGSLPRAPCRPRLALPGSKPTPTSTQPCPHRRRQRRTPSTHKAPQVTVTTCVRSAHRSKSRTTSTVGARFAALRSIVCREMPSRPVLYSRAQRAWRYRAGTAAASARIASSLISRLGSDSSGSGCWPGSSGAGSVVVPWRWRAMTRWEGTGKDEVGAGMNASW